MKALADQIYRIGNFRFLWNMLKVAGMALHALLTSGTIADEYVMNRILLPLALVIPETVAAQTGQLGSPSLTNIPCLLCFAL